MEQSKSTTKIAGVDVGKLRLDVAAHGSGETLGAMLLSEINIAYYQHLMSEIRQAISQGTFASFREQTRSNWAKGDIPAR